MTPIQDIHPLTLNQLNPNNDLRESLTRLEDQVRQSPASAGHRWALAEMLCLFGHWERALKQLQIGAQLQQRQEAAQWNARAQMLRGLVRAEAQRLEVFAGQLLPQPVVDRPQWMEDLARAIALNVQGKHTKADSIRRAALDAAPTRAVICERVVDAGAGAPEATVEQTLDWIADSDTRLGPVCEFIAAGSYRWVAFADIAGLRIERPRSLLDLVWLPVTLELSGTRAGATTLRGYMPTRYCGTATASAEPDQPNLDALMLARLTVWRECGDTGIFALGQKTLMTDVGDVPLLSLRSLRRTDAPVGAST